MLPLTCIFFNFFLQCLITYPALFKFIPRYFFWSCKLAQIIKSQGQCCSEKNPSNLCLLISKFQIIFYSFLNWFYRERGREKHWFVIPLIYAFMGCFLYVPWLGIESTTLLYQDDTLTSWATQPGPDNFLIPWCAKIFLPPPLFYFSATSCTDSFFLLFSSFLSPIYIYFLLIETPLNFCLGWK